MTPDMRNAMVDYLREKGWEAKVAEPVGNSDHFISLPVEVNITDPNLVGPVTIDIDGDEGLLVLHTREKRPWRTCTCEIELASPTSFDEMEQYLRLLESGDYDKD